MVASCAHFESSCFRCYSFLDYFLLSIVESMQNFSISASCQNHISRLDFCYRHKSLICLDKGISLKARKSEVQSVCIHLPLLMWWQLVNDAPVGEDKSGYLSGQSSCVNSPKFGVVNLFNLLVLLLSQESIVSVVAQNQSAIIPADDVVVNPKPCTWVVVDEHLLSGSDGKLPKHFVWHTVRFVHEQIITLSVLRILRILVTLELND